MILLTCGQLRSAGRPPTERSALKVEYIRSVERAGGAAALLANSAEESCTRAVVRAADALVLTGGADVTPDLYGQPRHPSVKNTDPLRDATERAAVAAAMRAGRPILAICRGIQMLNVALGGTLIQDIPSDRADAAEADGAAVKHNGADHFVRLAPGSMLAEIWPQAGLTVNSRHHQAIGRLAGSLRATAWAPDGIIEAAESTDGYPLLALQCHPEDLSAGDANFLAPFVWLVKTAAAGRR